MVLIETMTSACYIYGTEFFDLEEIKIRVPKKEFWSVYTCRCEIFPTSLGDRARSETQATMSLLGIIWPTYRVWQYEMTTLGWLAPVCWVLLFNVNSAGQNCSRWQKRKNYKRLRWRTHQRRENRSTWSETNAAVRYQGSGPISKYPVRQKAKPYGHRKTPFNYHKTDHCSWKGLNMWTMECSEQKTWRILSWRVCCPGFWGFQTKSSRTRQINMNCPSSV